MHKVNLQCVLRVMKTKWWSNISDEVHEAANQYNMKRLLSFVICIWSTFSLCGSTHIYRWISVNKGF